MPCSAMTDVRKTPSCKTGLANLPSTVSCVRAAPEGGGRHEAHFRSRRGLNTEASADCTDARRIWAPTDKGRSRCPPFLTLRGAWYQLAVCGEREKRKKKRGFLRCCKIVTQPQAYTGSCGGLEAYTGSRSLAQRLPHESVERQDLVEDEGSGPAVSKRKKQSQSLCAAAPCRHRAPDVP